MNFDSSPRCITLLLTVLCTTTPHTPLNYRECYRSLPAAWQCSYLEMTIGRHLAGSNIPWRASMILLGFFKFQCGHSFSALPSLCNWERAEVRRIPHRKRAGLQYRRMKALLEKWEGSWLPQRVPDLASKIKESHVLRKAPSLALKKKTKNWSTPYD